MKRLLSLLAGVCLMGLTSALIAAPSIYIGSINLHGKTFRVFAPETTANLLPGHFVYVTKGFGGKHYHYVVYRITKADCTSRHLVLSLERAKYQPPKSAGSYLHNENFKNLQLNVLHGKIKKWGKYVKTCPVMKYHYIRN